jgi:penicillin-binding protein 1C
MDADGTAPGILTIRLDSNGQMLGMDCTDLNGETGYETKTLAVWPGNLEPWIAPHLRRSEQVPEGRSSCQPPSLATAPLRIIGIEDGQTLMPASFKKTQELLLNTLGGFGKKALYVNGAYHSEADNSGLFRVEIARTGAQEIVIVDEQGALAKVNFEFRLRP